MQKIYVLLRHNQQTGPYSLEEIAKFDLKPYDLIWIEGKSAGWYYPQEIAPLQPYLSFLPKKQPAVQPAQEKPVFVTRPAVPPEPPKQPATVTEPVLPQEEFYAPPEPLSENIEAKVYAQFRSKATEEEIRPAAAAPVTQKKKPVPAMTVALAVVLVVGSVFAASWIMNRQPQETYQATPAPVSELPVQPEEEAKRSDIKQVAATTNSTRQNRVTEKKTARQPVVMVDAKTSRQSQANQPSHYPQEDEIHTPVPASREEEPPVTATESTEGTTAGAEPVEKKKKLREKFLDLFKKKPDEQKTEEARPAETVGGERSSTRRESSANLAQLVHVRFTIPNEWMMGINGAKATLVNRNNETITKATVEVQYYNDDNELLQKKIITFGKIDGKGSQTIAIPDHPSATKVDYSIVSVTGKPAA